MAAAIFTIKPLKGIQGLLTYGDLNYCNILTIFCYGICLSCSQLSACAILFSFELMENVILSSGPQYSTNH